MLRRSTHRLLASLFVAMSLLFSQMALASYACPMQADREVMARMMANGEPCEGMDQAQPVLCHQHSAGAPQSFEAVKLPTATLPAIVQVLVLSPLSVAEGCIGMPIAAVPEVRPPPDPVFLSTLRLRV